jgi:hypothetical protein
VLDAVFGMSLQHSVAGGLGTASWLIILSVISQTIELHFTLSSHITNACSFLEPVDIAEEIGSNEHAQTGEYSNSVAIFYGFWKTFGTCGRCGKFSTSIFIVSLPSRISRVRNME